LFATIPIFISCAYSVQTSEEIFSHMMPFSWRTFIPTSVKWVSYATIFRNFDYGRALFNSFFISAMTLLIGIMVNSLAGFAFAHFKFYGRELLFLIVLITFMIPFEAIAIPLYELINRLGLINTYAGLILPGVANGLVVFLFRQFFKGIPSALFDSARIDGASWFRIYISIVIPVSKPVTLSAGILIFISQWQAFFYPLLVANKPEYRVLQVAIANFFTEHETLWNLLFAAVVVAIAIPICILLPLQKYYIQAVTRSGLKE